jgi:putative glutamine amidotransferase
MKHKNQVKFPIIGISATLLMIESGSFMGRERSAVGHDYIRAIELAGGVPVVLPIVKEQHLIQQQIEMIDGLLLSGGYDVCPQKYGEEPKPGLEAICPERDAYELELVQIAHRLKKPILGICRGLQLLNVAFGGTLYQDIGLSFPTALQHHSQAKPGEGTHTVTILPGTALQQILQESTLLTNSFHHQAVKNVASSLIVNAHSTDGVIEGIESAEDLFILGVQWHPELMLEKRSQMLKLFHAFLEASRHRRIT